MSLSDQAKTELEDLIKKEQDLKTQLTTTKKQIKSIKNFLVSIGALEKRRKGK